MTFEQSLAAGDIIEFYDQEFDDYLSVNNYDDFDLAAESSLPKGKKGYLMPKAKTQSLFPNCGKNKDGLRISKFLFQEFNHAHQVNLAIARLDTGRFSC